MIYFRKARGFIAEMMFLLGKLDDKERLHLLEKYQFITVDLGVCFL